MAEHWNDPEWDADPEDVIWEEWEPDEPDATAPDVGKHVLSVAHDLTDDELRRFCNFDVFYDPMPMLGFIPQWAWFVGFTAIAGALAGFALLPIQDGHPLRGTHHPDRSRAGPWNPRRNDGGSRRGAGTLRRPDRVHLPPWTLGPDPGGGGGDDDRSRSLDAIVDGHPQDLPNRRGHHVLDATGAGRHGRPDASRRSAAHIRQSGGGRRLRKHRSTLARRGRR